MADIAWSEKLSVGVAALDTDHKKLIAIFNRLNRSIRAGEGQAVIGPCLDDLLAYTDYHFEAEEALMKLARYPDLAPHRQQHRALIERLTGIRDRYADDPDSIASTAVFDFLSNWLMRHILGDDQRYSPWLDRKRVEARTPTG